MLKVTPMWIVYFELFLAGFNMPFVYYYPHSYANWAAIIICLSYAAWFYYKIHKQRKTTRQMWKNSA